MNMQAMPLAVLLVIAATLAACDNHPDGQADEPAQRDVAATQSNEPAQQPDDPATQSNEPAQQDVAATQSNEPVQQPDDAAAVPQTRRVTYADDVAPILHKHCAECHLAGGQGAVATGFMVDSYASVLKDDRYGPVVTAGSAKTSTLYNMVSGKDNLTISMPHNREPLSDEEIETIRVWIDNGAVEN